MKCIGFQYEIDKTYTMEENNTSFLYKISNTQKFGKYNF